MTDTAKDIAALDAGIAALERVTVLERENEKLRAACKNVFNGLDELAESIEGRMYGDASQWVEFHKDRLEQALK